MALHPDRESAVSSTTATRSGFLVRVNVVALWREVFCMACLSGFVVTLGAAMFWN